ncbi:hypothetical protein BH10ACI1_BH10ACI1_26900 [soil metagenome]
MLKKFGFKFAVIAVIALSLVSETVAQTRLRFARGGTSTTVSGTLAARSARRYVLSLSEGQTFSIGVTSGNNNVSIKASDVHGTFEEKYDGYFEVETDANGDHYITLRNNGNRSTRFTMTVSAY